MKKIVILLFTILLTNGAVNAQQPQAAVQVAQRIAQKMKDSLNLTGQQQNQLFQINMQLHDRKQELRQQTTNQDSLRIRIQHVERDRDSLYHTVLNNETYQLYLQKKRYLVSNN